MFLQINATKGGGLANRRFSKLGCSQAISFGVTRKKPKNCVFFQNKINRDTILSKFSQYSRRPDYRALRIQS